MLLVEFVKAYGDNPKRIIEVYPCSIPMNQ